jgi:hypothetical protein
MHKLSSPTPSAASTRLKPGAPNPRQPGGSNYSARCTEPRIFFPHKYCLAVRRLGAFLGGPSAFIKFGYKQRSEQQVS